MRWVRKETSFTKAFDPLAKKVKDVLTTHLGEYEIAEDDAWFVVGCFRQFAHWGGAGKTDNYSPKNGPLSNRKNKKDFSRAAIQLQQAYDAVKELCDDYGAAESIAWAIFENAPPDKKKSPETFSWKPYAG